MINGDTGLSTGNVNRSLLIMDHPRCKIWIGYVP